MQMFSMRQRSTLDVFGLWAVLRGQLLVTDDSFVFNRVLARLKDTVTNLSSVSDEDEQAFHAAKVKPMCAANFLILHGLLHRKKSPGAYQKYHRRLPFELELVT